MGGHIKHRARARRFEPLQHARFRRLWTAGLVSDLGDAVGRVALTMLVQAETGSAVVTGSVVVMYSLPFLGPGQWLTARLAHLDRKRVLITADLLRAACFGAMVLPVGVPVRLALLLVASLATPPFNAVAGAAVARSVPERLVGQAAGLRTGTTELAFVVGFGLGGLLADLASPVAVIGLDAVSFAASALIIAGTSLDRATAGHDRPAVRLSDATQAIRSDPWCRRILLFTTATFALVLVPETLVAAYADETFPGTDGITGALAALAAIGVVGATLLPRPDRHDRLVRHAAVMTVVACSLAATSFLAPDRILTAALAYLCLGPALAIRVHGYTVMTKRIDDRLLAPALSIANGTLAASYLVAGLGGGLLVDAVGADEAFTIAVVGALVLGVWAYVVPVRAGTTATRSVPA